MIDGPFAFALTAGMIATVNPCGFALLPAYLSAFVGLDEDRSQAAAVRRALAVSLVMTAGFVTVFAVFGAVISQIFTGIEQHLPWATIVIGIGLIGLGIYLLTGRQLVLNIPKLQRGGSDGTLPSMYLFGVSYAVASLSCTIAPFLAVTTTTFNNESFLSGVAVFAVYGAGMGLVVTVLTVAVALAKNGIVAKFRSLLPKINRIAGVFLLVAGAYVAYFGWYEVRLFRGDIAEDPIVDAASDVQTWLQGLFPSTQTAPWYFLGGAVIVVAVYLATRLWSGRARPDDGVADAAGRPDDSADGRPATGVSTAAE